MIYWYRHPHQCSLAEVFGCNVKQLRGDAGTVQHRLLIPLKQPNDDLYG